MLLGDLLSLAPPFEMGTYPKGGDELPASYIVAAMLIEKLSIGSLPSSNTTNPVFISHEPDKPDACITIYDTAGIEEIRGMQGDLCIHHGIQIRTRGKSYLTAWQLLNNIDSEFISIANEEVAASEHIYTINTVTSTSDIVSIGPTGQRILNKLAKNFIVSMTNN